MVVGTNDTKPWVLKYIPEKVKDVIGQDRGISELKEFIEQFRKQKKKAMMIYGPAGCGKTVAVYALANELDLEVLELNASDFRTRDAIKSILGSASKQMSLFAKGKIILVDEVDGISGHKDRGGLPELVKMIKETAFPIIITANDPFDKKFSGLRKAAYLVEFNDLDYKSVAAVLKKIAKKENIKCEEDAVLALGRRSGGDLRGAINDFQSLVELSGKLTRKQLEDMSEREHVESIQNALTKVFKTTDPKIAISAFDYVNEDFDKIRLWLDENLPYEYEKPEDLARAYDYLSKADVMSRRIRRWQYWRFLVYVNAYLSAGIAVSKDEKYKKFIEYKQTRRLLKIWMANQKYAKRKAIAEKIGDKTHCSTKEALKSTVPYFQMIFRKNKQAAQKIADELDLDRDEMEWLGK